MAMFGLWNFGRISSHRAGKDPSGQGDYGEPGQAELGGLSNCMSERGEGLLCLQALQEQA